MENCLSKGNVMILALEGVHRVGSGVLEVDGCGVTLEAGGGIEFSFRSRECFPYEKMGITQFLESDP